MVFINKYILFVITIFFIQCSNNNDSQDTKNNLKQAETQLNDIFEYFNEAGRLVNEKTPEKIEKKKNVLDIFFFNIANIIQDKKNDKLIISQENIHQILNILSQCNDYFQGYENKNDSLKKSIKYVILYFEEQLKKFKEQKKDPNKDSKDNPIDIKGNPDDKETKTNYYDQIVQTIKTELGLIELNKIDYNNACDNINDFIVNEIIKDFDIYLRKMTSNIEFQEKKINNNYLPHIYSEYIMNMLKKYVDYYDKKTEHNENYKNILLNSKKTNIDFDTEVNYEIKQNEIDYRINEKINENFYKIILDNKYLISRVELYNEQMILNQYPMTIMQVLADIDDRYNNSDNEIFTIKMETNESEMIVYNTVCYLILSSFNKNYCIEPNFSKLFNHIRFQDVPILKALRIFNMIKTSFENADLKYYKSFILSHNNQRDENNNYNTDPGIKKEHDNFNERDKTTSNLKEDSMARKIIKQIYIIMQQQITGKFTTEQDIFWCTNKCNNQNFSSYSYLKNYAKYFEINGKTIKDSDLISTIPYNLILNIPSEATSLFGNFRLIFTDQDYAKSILYQIVLYMNNYSEITQQGLDKLIKQIKDTYNRKTFDRFFSSKTNLEDDSYKSGNGKKLNTSMLINYLKQCDESSKKENFDTILIHRILSALLYLDVITDKTKILH